MIFKLLCRLLSQGSFKPLILPSGSKQPFFGPNVSCIHLIAFHGAGPDDFTVFRAGCNGFKWNGISRYLRWVSGFTKDQFCATDRIEVAVHDSYFFLVGSNYTCEKRRLWFYAIIRWLFIFHELLTFWAAICGARLAALLTAGREIFKRRDISKVIILMSGWTQRRSRLLTLIVCGFLSRPLLFSPITRKA